MVGLDLPPAQVLRVSTRGLESLVYTYHNYLNWNLVSYSSGNIQGKGKVEAVEVHNTNVLDAE